MISAWYLIPAMMAGAAIGILLVAICVANRPSDNERNKYDE